jgi:hypothetical protein
MATLAEFRTKYPQYNDMPDVELADSLHQKFYSDIPRPQFFQQLDIVGSQLPGSEKTITLPRSKPGIMDKLGAVLEVPATMATGIVSSAVGLPYGLYKGLTSGKYGTPEAPEIAQREAAAFQERNTYQPRTETAQDVLGGMAKVLGALPPTLGATGSTLNALVGPVTRQMRAAVAPVAASTQQRMAALLAPKPAMMGGGAASADETVLRQQRALSQDIPLTKGQQLQDLAQQQFESDVVKQSPDLATSLSEFQKGQKKKIQNRFEQLIEQTGADVDVSDFRKTGAIVDSEIVKQFEAKNKLVDDTYQKARNAGETKAVVDTSKLDKWIADHSAEAVAVPEINAIKSKLEALKKAAIEPPEVENLSGFQKKRAMTANKLQSGQVTIDDLENLYKVAGQLSKPGDPSNVFMKQVKTLINDMTEGAGGDLYRAARAERADMGRQFENTYRVAKLLGTRGGYADRAVALDDVFKHVVLDGSLEEMRTVTTLLKKGGEEGQKAYAALQGQTIQHLKNQLEKNTSGNLSYDGFSKAITALDREGKLDYMFGKKGRETLIDLQGTLRDALVPIPGSVNTSSSGNVVTRTLNALVNKLPLAKDIGQAVENQKIKKQVEQSINYDATKVKP